MGQYQKVFIDCMYKGSYIYVEEYVAELIACKHPNKLKTYCSSKCPLLEKESVNVNVNS